MNLWTRHENGPSQGLSAICWYAKDLPPVNNVAAWNATDGHTIVLDTLKNDTMFLRTEPNYDISFMACLDGFN